jgi:transposase
LAALKGEKTLAELAQQFDVHANQMTQWKAQLLGGVAGIFGSEAKAGPAAPTVDLKSHHAKIGELTLFFGRCALQGGHAERKAMIDKKLLRPLEEFLPRPHFEHGPTLGARINKPKGRLLGPRRASSKDSNFAFRRVGRPAELAPQSIVVWRVELS